MKPYVKPSLYYENFTLSHSIAACSGATPGTDQVDVGGVTLTVFTADTCDIPSDQVETYCYQTGSEGYAVFSS